MPRFRRILAAVDGSEPAQNTLDAALDLAQDLGGQIEALAVEGPLPRYAATVGEAEEALHERDAFFAGVLSHRQGPRRRARAGAGHHLPSRPLGRGDRPLRRGQRRRPDS